jgi:hypothetical protein
MVIVVVDTQNKSLLNDRARSVTQLLTFITVLITIHRYVCSLTFELVNNRHAL